jgi:membrane protease subunit HflK
MSWDWEKLKQQQGGRGGIPPQMDQVVKQIKKFRLPGGPIVFGVLIVAFVALTSFYTVNQDEVGMVQRFGRYIETTQPGLNFKFPFGIDTVTKVNVKRVQTEEFGSAPAEADFRARTKPGADPGSVSLMLTGDLNVALVPWIVQYRIKDPYNYLFKVANVKRLLTDMSEAVMRLVVGDRSINEVISKRGEIANEARDLLQRELDQAETGLHIVTIELKRTNVPVPVQPSFNEVNQATQEKEQMIYQANEDYNKAIPAARGTAERTIREAEGYALNRVNRAQGDAARFRQVVEEYRKAKEITERRLYLEKMRIVLEKMGPVYIIDPDQKSMLPLLNLIPPAGK